MPDHPLEITDPADPLFEHPLQELNLQFSRWWHLVGEAACEAIDPMIVAHSTPKGGRYVLYHDGCRDVAEPVPPAFRLMKSASHVPLAIAAGHQLGESLAPLITHIEQAIGRLDSDALCEQGRKECRNVLEASLVFIESGSTHSQAEVDAFLRSVEAASEVLITLSGALQVETFTAVLLRWRHEVGEEAWASIRAIVGTPFSVSEHGVHYQVLLAALGKEALGTRFLVGTNIKDESLLRAKLGTMQANRNLCRQFFDDSARMDRELIGDAAEAAIERLGCPHARGCTPS